MNKNELFRAINKCSPDVVERLITHWGTLQLSEYLSDLLGAVRSGARPEFTDDVIHALTSLGAEHDREFPQYAIQTETVSAGQLEQIEYFKTINSRFPRIGRRLTSSWGHSTFTAYVNELLNDTRAGRQGFPEAVMLALFKLMEEHDKAFPQYVIKVSDLWSVDNKLF